MHLGQLVAQLCCQDVGERHELLCLICGISKHVSLVTGTCLLQGLCSKTMDSLPNVWALLFQVDKDLYKRLFQLMCNIQILPTVLLLHAIGFEHHFANITRHFHKQVAQLNVFQKQGI